MASKKAPKKPASTRKAATKPAAKKPAAKKPAAKKPAAKKPAAKKPAAKKPAAKKPVPRKPAAKKPVPKKPAVKRPAPKKDAKSPPPKRVPPPAPPQAPLHASVHRMSYDDGGFGLFFTCDAFFAMGAERVFEEGDAYPNGPGWESVVAPAFERAHPAIADQVEYDCEADTFVARAADDAHLDALASVIAAITASPAALARAVAARDPNRD